MSTKRNFTGFSKLQGEIVFSDVTYSLVNTTANIYLEETTLVDAPAKVVAHHVINNLSANIIQNGRISFTIEDIELDEKARYTVRVFIDVDGNGKISKGDYINFKSFPVLTHGYPSYIEVHVEMII